MWKKLLLAVCVVGTAFAISPYGDEPKNSTQPTGWTAPGWFEDDPHALTEIPATWDNDGAGLTRLLYRDYQDVNKVPYEPRAQGQAPSCVGQATAAACDFLAAVQIKEGRRERGPPGDACAATIYGWSRINIGGIDPGSFGGGSHVRWAVAAIQRYGVVPLMNYPQYKLDLSEPSADRCVQYGYSGVPPQLEIVGQRHIVVEYIKVETFEEVRDAVQNGCPIVIGSNVGFGRKSVAQRDSEGFLNRPTNFFGFNTSRWNHAMCIVGMCDEGRRGALILNSWGSQWVDGPKRFGDEPEGSFWADASDIEDIVSQGDSYAIRMFVGYNSYDLWR